MKNIIKSFITIIFILSFSILVYSDSFYAPSSTPDSTRVPNNQALINISINNTNTLTSFRFMFDFQQNFIYDKDLMLMLNFDNITADEDVNTTRDRSIYSNNGTFKNGASYNNSGYYGKAVTFDGVDDFVLINDSSSLNATENMTIMAWVRVEAGGDHDPIVGVQDAAGSRYQFMIFNTGALDFHITGVADITSAGTGVNNKNWHHVAVVRNGTSGNWNYVFYVDGSFDGEVVSNINNLVGTPATGFTIGRASTTDMFKGEIDEVRIYNRSVNRSEIEQMYMSNLYKFDRDKWQFSVNESRLVYDRFYNYSSNTVNGSGSNSNTSTGLHSVRVAFVAPSVSNRTNISTQLKNSQTILNVTMENAENLSKFIWNWNGTNYTFFNDSLMALYNFDNVSAFPESTRAIDVARGNNLTFSGGGSFNITDGVYGGSIFFPFGGAMQMLNSSPATVTANGSLTISVWLHPRTAFFNDGGIVSLTTTADNITNYGLYTTAGGRAKFYYFNNERWFTTQMPTLLTFNAWQHITVVFNATNRQVIMYRNGVIDVQNRTGENLEINESNFLHVGGMGLAEGGVAGSTYKGNIDQLEIWNTSFEPDEVRQHYYSALYKNSNSTWQFVSNQSNLTFGYYSAQAIATNSIGQDNATEVRSFVVQNNTPIRLNFTIPTPANNSETNQTQRIFNLTISNSSLMNKFIWNWNGTNYTFYSENLSLMLNFNNVTSIGDSNTQVVDLSLYKNNITCYNGAVEFCNLTIGKYGTGGQFDGIDDYINTSLILNGSAISMEAWVSLNDQVSFDMVLSYGTNAENNPEMRFSGGAMQLIRRVDNVGVSDAVTSAGLGFIHWVGVANKTTLLLYKNGVLVGTNNVLHNINSTTSLRIGRRSDNVFFFNGSIDEVMVYNRSLSSEEVKQHYYSNLYKFNNDTWQFTSNQSNLTVGNYTYFASAFDSLGNENQTEIRSLDIIPSNSVPTLTNLLFNQTSYRRGELINITTTYADADLDAGTVTFNISNSTGLIETREKTGVASGTTININFSSIFEKGDQLTVSVTAFDGIGNSSARVNTTNINNTLGTITNLVFNSTVFYKNDLINLSVSWNDTDADTATITFNVSNSTGLIETRERTGITSGSTTSINFSSIFEKGDQLQFSVRAFDGDNTSSRVNSTNINNTNATLTNLVFNQSIYRKNEQVNVSLRYFDVDLDLSTIYFNISNLTGLIEYRQLNGVSNGSLVSINFSNTFNKGNILNITAVSFNDTFNVSEVKNFTTINNTIPTFIINSPANNLHDNISLVTNFTMFDVDVDTMNVTLFINSTTSGNHTRFSIINGSTINISALNMNTNGNFTWFLRANDSMQTDTNTFNFIFDTILPVITWNVPFTDNNQERLGKTNVSMNITIFDINLLRVNISVRNVTTGNYVQTITFDNISQVNQTFNINFTSVFPNAGNYSIIVTASDQQSNAVTLNTLIENVNFIFDNQTPSLNLVSPTPSNGSRQINNIITINATIQDEFFAGCVLTLSNNSRTENITMSRSGNQCQLTLNTIDGMKYFYNISANDTNSNYITIPEKNFSENSRPTISLNLLENLTISGNSSFRMNWTGNDSDGDFINFTLFINGTINMTTNDTNFTLTIPRFLLNQPINWTVSVDDSFEQFTPTNRTFMFRENITVEDIILGLRRVNKNTSSTFEETIDSPTIKKVTLHQNITVVNNQTQFMNIIYTINISDLPLFSIRNQLRDNATVNGQFNNITISNSSSQINITINIGHNGSGISLFNGNYNFTFTYFYQENQVQGGSRGSGVTPTLNKTNITLPVQEEVKSQITLIIEKVMYMSKLFYNTNKEALQIALISLISIFSLVKSYNFLSRKERKYTTQIGKTYEEEPHTVKLKIDGETYVMEIEK